MSKDACMVTREDITVTSQKMRQHAEENIMLLEKLFSFADGLGKKQEKLEEQLKDESSRRTIAEGSLHILQGQMTDLETRTKDLNSKIDNLTVTIQDKDVKYDGMVVEKDGKIKELYDAIQEQEYLMRGLKQLRENVDCCRVGNGYLKEPCGCCMFPNNNILVADTKEGLILFNCNTEMIKQVRSDNWKWPQGIAYDVENHKIYVSMLAKDETTKDENAWNKVIGIFDLNLQLEKVFDGPNDPDFDNVAKERLAMGKLGELYMCLRDQLSSSLWKYMAGQWFMVTRRPGAAYIDVQLLSSHASFTELVIVEAKMGYVYKLSISGANLADRKSVACVEKPGCCCVDEKGRLFVQDIMSGKIREIDHCKWEVKRDICLVDENVKSLTAANGYLGVVLSKDASAVKIFKYE